MAGLNELVLSSESDSDGGKKKLTNFVFLFTIKTKSIWESAYTKRRQTHGEFVPTLEFSDEIVHRLLPFESKPIQLSIVDDKL